MQCYNVNDGYYGVSQINLLLWIENCVASFCWWNFIVSKVVSVTVVGHYQEP